jgi:hypothetical protein
MAVRAAESLQRRGEIATPRTVGALVLAAVILASVAAALLMPPAVSEGERAAAQGAFEAATGVRVVRVALTGGGGLVELRYQVLDASQAAGIHDRPPTLVDERTDEVIDTYFMGHVHGSTPKTGLSYPLLFVNEGGLIVRGATVTVAIGGGLLERVVVQ